MLNPATRGASDAYLSSGDLVKNRTLLNIPLAISAQTVIYNLPGLLGMPYAEAWLATISRVTQD